MITLNSSQSIGTLGRAPLLVAALLTIVSGSALAQSAADNIRPVAEVCMAGQPCVGQPAGGAMSASSSRSASGTSAAQETASAPASEPASAPAADQADATDSAPATEMAAAASDVDAQAIYNQNCMACHMTGAAGAPKLDDEAAWNERLEKGMDAVMANVYNGIGAMPARGLCMSCSDADLRAVVDYMISQ